MVITLARLTGGLLESAVPIENNQGNAIVFDEYSKEAFVNALREAVELMQTDAWEEIQLNAPKTVKTWKNQFKEYAKIIAEIRERKSREINNSSSFSNYLLPVDILPALDQSDETSTNEGKSAFIGFDSSVSQKDADIRAKENAYLEEYSTDDLSLLISLIGRGERKIYFGYEGENNQEIREIVKLAIEALGKKGIRFKVSKDFGRLANLVENVVYIDEFLKDIFDLIERLKNNERIDLRFYFKGEIGFILCYPFP